MDQQAGKFCIEAAIFLARLPLSGFHRNNHVAQQVWIDRRIRPAGHREGQDVGRIIACQILLIKSGDLGIIQKQNTYL